MDPKPLFRTRFPLASWGRFVMVGLVRLAKLAVAFTPVNCVWLRALNASSRISSLTCCRTANTLEIDRSRLLIGGAQRKNRADSSPWLPGCGGAKHDVLICR